MKDSGINLSWIISPVSLTDVSVPLPTLYLSITMKQTTYLTTLLHAPISENQHLQKNATGWPS